MSHPFAMHWFVSTIPDFNNIFHCFGCQSQSIFPCFSLACDGKPKVHYFCRRCALFHDERLDFTCPACLLRTEVDKSKIDIVDQLIEDTTRRRDIRELGDGAKLFEFENGFVFVQLEEVKKQGQKDY